MRVAVIGAGPAGSSAAARILELMQNAVVDIYELRMGPRSFCAGGLGFYAVRDLSKWGFVAESIRAATEWQVSEFKIILSDHGEPLDEAVLAADELGIDSLGVVMDRRRFDRELLKKALGYGARLVRKSVRPEDLEDSYDFVIDARGLSVWVSRGGPDHEFVIQWEPKGKHDVMELYFDKTLFEGYYWVFPKRDTVEYGYGEHVDYYRAKKDLTDSVMARIAGYDDIRELEEKSTRTIAAILPLYTPACLDLGRGRVFRVGTAACLVDPLTGAGIKHAVTSGAILGELIAKLRSSLLVRAFYKAKLTKTLAELNLSYELKHRVLSYLRKHNDLDFLHKLKSEILTNYDVSKMKLLDVAVRASRIIFKMLPLD